jgi:hypothetical protein
MYDTVSSNYKARQSVSNQHHLANNDIPVSTNRYAALADIDDDPITETTLSDSNMSSKDLDRH